MYEILTVHMLWISLVLCITGLIRRAVNLVILTKKKSLNYASVHIDADNISESHSLFKRLTGFLRGFFYRDEPVLFYSTLIFHLLLIATPVFLYSHGILLERAWGINPGFIPGRAGDIFAFMVTALGLFLLFRRIFIIEVNILTTWYDYLLLIITLTPFVTGLFAYHQSCEYSYMIIAHIVSAEIFLIALGWTKLGHMVFFIFSRFLVSSEFSFTGGSRRW